MDAATSGPSARALSSKLRSLLCRQNDGHRLGVNGCDDCARLRLQEGEEVVCRLALLDLPNRGPTGPDAGEERERAALIKGEPYRRPRPVRHNADEIMAEIFAKRLVEYLGRAGFVVMKRAPIRGGAALGRGFEGSLWAQGDSSGLRWPAGSRHADRTTWRSATVVFLASKVASAISGLKK